MPSRALPDRPDLDQYRTRIGKSLQTSSNIHAIAVEVLSINQDISQVDANA